MITLDELCGVLDRLGLPWANEGFADDERPDVPYIVLEADFEEVAYADDMPWARWMPYEILLYTSNRSYETEARVADLLDEAGCAYEKSITHNDGERLVEASFSVCVTE